jgi:hypothetical protein
MVFRWFFNDQTIGTCAPYNVDFQYKIRTVLGTFLPILVTIYVGWILSVTQMDYYQCGMDSISHTDGLLSMWDVFYQSHRWVTINVGCILSVTLMGYYQCGMYSISHTDGLLSMWDGFYQSHRWITINVGWILSVTQMGYYQCGMDFDSNPSV